MRGNGAIEWLRSAGALALALILGSCTVGPEYSRPSLDVPSAYKSASSAEAAESDLGQNWWRLFQDSELSALEDEALKANQSIKAAVARVAQARAAGRSVNGSFYPVVTLDPSATRSRTPGAGGQPGSRAATNTNVQIPFDLSYEIDTWGRVRRSYEAAEAQTLASVYDLEVVRQTLMADLATDYFNLRSLDAQHQILARSLDLYQQQLDLTQNQCKAGLADETAVLQATAQLESTRAQAADTERQRADLEHAIAILVGRPPAEFSLDVRPLDAALPVIPTGLPADLLGRRPDVAEAEQNLAAACAQIGVAKAEFFPTIRLAGSAGLVSSDIGDVLNWRNRSWSFGPSVSLPIFNGGQLSASLEKTKARYDELEATYRSSVLTAFADVENSLTDLQSRSEAAHAQAKAVAASREYLRLTNIQYQTGGIDYLHVVSAEQTLVSNELSEAQILNQRMNSTVLLIKAIGGGWDSQSPLQEQGSRPSDAAEPS